MTEESTVGFMAERENGNPAVQGLQSERDEDREDNMKMVSLGSSTGSCIEKVEKVEKEILQGSFFKTEFPFEAIPSQIKTYLDTVSDVLCIDKGITYSLLFPLLGAAAGNSVSISPALGWEVNPFFWMPLVGETGSGKSPLINELMKPFHSRQEKMCNMYERAFKDWNNGGGEGEKPSLHHVYTTDFTIESLSSIYLASGRGILIAVQEVGGVLTGLNQYKTRGKGNDRQRFIDLFDGNAWKIDRKGVPPIYLPKTGASILGGIQPERLPYIFQEEGFEDGLIPRFLFLPIDCGPRKFNPEGIPEGQDSSYKNLLEWAWDIPVNVVDGKIMPFKLTLDREAQKLWGDFHDDLRELETDLPGRLKGFIPKWLTYSLKVPGVLHLLNERERGVSPRDIQQAISRETVDLSIQVSQFLFFQAGRVMDLYVQVKTIRRDEALLIQAIHSLRDKVKNGKLPLNEIQGEYNQRVPEAERFSNYNRELSSCLRKLGFETCRGEKGLTCIRYNHERVESLRSQFIFSTFSTFKDADQYCISEVQTSSNHLLNDQNTGCTACTIGNLNLTNVNIYSSHPEKTIHSPVVSDYYDVEV